MNGLPDDQEDSEDWGPEDGAEIAECDWCGGQEKMCVHRPDPFLAEVFPEEDNPCSWICWPCFEERCDEI